LYIHNFINSFISGNKYKKYNEPRQEGKGGKSEQNKTSIILMWHTVVRTHYRKTNQLTGQNGSYREVPAWYFAFEVRGFDVGIPRFTDSRGLCLLSVWRLCMAYTVRVCFTRWWRAACMIYGRRGLAKTRRDRMWQIKTHTVSFRRV